MGRNLLAQIAKYISSQKRRKAGYWVLFGLSAVVVFCTTYALILPAITVSNEVLCGMEAHTHSESCWSLQPAEPKVELICEDWKEADVVFHHHDGFCYDGAGRLICPLEEREAHVHGEQCYIEERELICRKEETGDALSPGEGAEPVPEVVPEVVEPHVHTDACYTMVQGALICGQDEVEGHIHDESCYIVENTAQYYYTFGQEQTADGHQHDDSCLAVRLNPILTCTREEIEGHIHTDDCYEWESVLTCDETEGPEPFRPEEPVVTPEPAQPGEPHVHTDECYEITRLLVCQEEELALHTHGPECYETVHVDDGQGGLEEREVLTCTLPVVIEHQHTEECVQTVESEDKEVMVRTCGMTVHVHTDECYVDMGPEPDPHVCGLAEHQHSEECWFEDGELRCTMPEHTHTEECLDPENFPAPEYPVEMEYICGLEEHEHTEDCFLDGVLMCEKEEHTHGEACLPEDGEPEEEEPGWDAWGEPGELPDETGAYAQLLPPEPETEPEVEPETEPDIEIRQMSLLSAAYAPMAMALADKPVVYADGGAQDFTEWIKKDGVKLEYKDGSEWKDITDETEVRSDGQLRVGISYVIPAGGLENGNKVIYYQLPDNLKLTEASVVTNGKVTNSSGGQMGTYSISKDGLITITFLDEVAAKNWSGENGSGSPIEGTVNLEAAVDQIETNDKDQVELEFREDLKLTFGVKEIKGDLTVQKQGDIVDLANGIAEYIITVKSKDGTFDKVTLTDYMEKIGLDGNVTVTDKNGNTVPVNQDEFTEKSDGFELVLPQMQAGDTYTITYRAKVPDNAEADPQVHNKVTAKTKNNDDDEIEKTGEVRLNFTRTDLNKYGQVADWIEGKPIQWTITVNQAKNDISGWVLRDELNGKEFKGPVTITKEDGNTVIEKDVPLPHIFPEGSNETYKIIYTTPVDRDADKELGENKENNVATLKPPKPGPDPDDPDDGYKTGYDVTTGTYNPLEKSGEIKKDEKGKLTILWKIKIDASEGEIAAPWTFEDDLWDKQTFEEVYADLENRLKAELAAYGPTVTLSTVRDEGRLKITFDQPLKRGEKIEFSYNAEVTLKDPDSMEVLRNQAKVISGGKEVKTEGKVEHKPSNLTVKKTDNAPGAGVGDTEKDYYELKDDKLEGHILQWHIRIDVPDNYNSESDVTVTEELPEGVDLAYLEILADDIPGFGATIVTDQVEKDTGLIPNHKTIANYNLSFERHGQTIQIVIPKELLKHEKLTNIRMVVKVRLQEDLSDWDEVSQGVIEGVFENKVKVHREGEDDIEDHQKQTVKKDYTKRVLDKSVPPYTGDGNKSWGIYENNVLPYTVIVNPEGLDLLPGADFIELIDELAVQSGQAVVSANLVPGSLKVYRTDTTPEEELEVTFDYEVSSRDETGTQLYTLRIQLPDSVPLRVEYGYKVISPVENAGVNMNNAARLVGHVYDENNGKTTMTVKVTQSGSTADIKGVNIFKRDARNGSALGGAEFALYWYDPQNPAAEEDGYVRQYPAEGGQTYITGNDGYLALRDLAHNRAYKLVEVKAPDGYELNDKPYYFYVYESNTNLYPEIMPSDFTGDKYLDGGTIWYSNLSEKVSVGAHKYWVDLDGKTPLDDPGVRSVTVHVMQQAYVRESDLPAPGDGGGEPARKVHITVNALTEHGTYLTQLDGGSGEFDSGTLVTLSFRCDYAVTWPKDWFLIKIDGQSIGEPVRTVDGEAEIYTYSFTITDDITITGKLDWNPSDLHVTASAAGSGVSEDLVPYGEPREMAQTLTLNAGNGWQASMDGLPRSGSITVDGKQVDVSYRYYVVETVPDGFAPSYSADADNPIDEGTITITNRKLFTLPRTGGPGSMMYTAGGPLLCAAVGGLLYSRKSRRKGADDRG